MMGGWANRGGLLIAGSTLAGAAYPWLFQARSKSLCELCGGEIDGSMRLAVVGTGYAEGAVS